MPIKKTKSSYRKTQRDPDKRSQTFWLESSLVQKLDELSAASNYSKSDLIRHWIDQEYSTQLKRGALSKPRVPFPD